MALRLGVITQSGAWFYLGEEKIAQGRDNCVKKFQEESFFTQVKELVTNARAALKE